MRNRSPFMIQHIPCLQSGPYGQWAFRGKKVPEYRCPYPKHRARHETKITVGKTIFLQHPMEQIGIRRVETAITQVFVADVSFRTGDAQLPVTFKRLLDDGEEFGAGDPEQSFPFPSPAVFLIAAFVMQQ